MSKLPASFTPARSNAQRPTTRGAADFLQGNDKLAALLPNAARLGRLQQDCLALMPLQFASCTVLQISEEQLSIAVPNAALATRMKQQSPKLLSGLREKGWPIQEIKLKIRVLAPEPARTPRSLFLPTGAVASFAELDNSLPTHPRNQALKEALRNLVARRQNKKV
jgi:hypothetical protein